MLYYLIISIEPKTAGDAGYNFDEYTYHSADYYADRFENEHFSYGRLYENFTSLEDFKSDTSDWHINSKEPNALLTISYDRDTNQYTATDLYIINSLHKDKEHHFQSPVVLADLGLAHEETFQPRF